MKSKRHVYILMVYCYRTGSILIFQHDIMHEGSLLEDGIKYTIRTDVMYDITTKQENADEVKS